MLSLLLIFANLILIGVSLYSWKKYKDKNFIFVAFSGLISLSIATLNYSGIVLFRYALISFPLSLAVMNWYDWKKFNDKHFLYHTILSSAFILLLIYSIYFTEVKLSLPLSEWPVSSFIIAIAYIGILIAFIAL